MKKKIILAIAGLTTIFAWGALTVAGVFANPIFSSLWIISRADANIIAIAAATTSTIGLVAVAAKARRA